MISLLAGLQGIPGDLYEAARVDGASRSQRFCQRHDPAAATDHHLDGVLDFIWTSQQFALIWMTTGGGPIDATEMLSTYTYKLAFAKYEFALASTSAVLMLSCRWCSPIFYVRHQKARDWTMTTVTRRHVRRPWPQRRRPRRPDRSAPCFAGLPVLWMLSSSFKPNTEIFEFPPRLITESFSFDAYGDILTDPDEDPVLHQQLRRVGCGDRLHALRRDPRRLRVQPLSTSR